MVSCQQGELMKFQSIKLIEIREKLGINKAEAARRLNTTAMAYGRYEKGEREPSYQMVCYIAQVFGTTPEYLYGETDSSVADTIVVSRKENPELFHIVENCQKDQEFAKRLITFINGMKQ